MSAGENRGGSSAGSMASRYAPFLAIIALQLVLVTIAPKQTSTVTTTATGAAPPSDTATGPTQTGELTPSGSNQATVSTQPGGAPSSMRNVRGPLSGAAGAAAGVGVAAAVP